MLSDDVKVVRELRSLRSLLTQSRKNAGFDREYVAEKLGLGLEKLDDIENGPGAIDPADLLNLLTTYELNGSVVAADELVDVARRAADASWWLEHRGGIYTDVFLRYIEAEFAASEHKTFRHDVIPGLLQTRQYISALWENTNYSPERKERGIGIRLRRQEVLAGQECKFSFVLDESVLRRNIGGRNTMVEQLKRIATVASQENVSFRIVPFSAARHFMQSSFTILENATVPDWTLSVGSAFTRSDVLIQKSDNRPLVPDEHVAFFELYANLEKIALSNSDSLALLNEIVENAGDLFTE